MEVRKTRWVGVLHGALPDAAGSIQRPRVFDSTDDCTEQKGCQNSKGTSLTRRCWGVMGSKKPITTFSATQKQQNERPQQRPEMPLEERKPGTFLGSRQAKARVEAIEHGAPNPPVYRLVLLNAPLQPSPWDPAFFARAPFFISPTFPPLSTTPHCAFSNGATTFLIAMLRTP